MNIPTEVTQVLVAGAGPVGLMLAAELAQGGADVLVVENRSSGTVGESRAVGVNARSLEILAQRGLADRCLAAGSPMPAVLFGGVFMNPGAYDPDWPQALRLPQHQTERILLEHAQECGARIMWSTNVDDLDQDDDGVEVHVRTADGARLVRAEYVIGCDGGRSVVRDRAGIAFPGVQGEDWWVVGDIELADPPSGKAAFGYNDRVGFYQVSRAEADVHRLTLMCRNAPADRTAPVTLEEIRRAMIDGLGTDHGLQGARWMSRWSDGFHQATQYRKGRVLLAGDAAHTHPPIGGQGLNVGLQDAANLGWKLSAVLCGAAGEELLDTYQAERFAVEQDATRWSLAQTELVKPGPRREALRDVFSDLVTAVPDVCLRLSGQLSGLDLRYDLDDDSHAMIGRRMPDLPLVVDGADTDVFTLLRPARPLLIEFGARRHAGVAGQRPWLRHVTADYQPDVRGAQWHFAVYGDVPAFDAVLVRPDGYVAWVGAGEDRETSAAGLVDALDRWAGPAVQQSVENVALRDG